MLRIGIFGDFANLDHAFFQYGARIDVVGLREYLASGRLIVDTFIYLPISPYKPEAKKNFVDFLKNNDFVVRSKIGKPRPNNRWKCNFDVEMAVDILHYMHHARLDVIIIGSGDGDMTPICDEVRRAGIRCEVASTGDCVSEELRKAASGFIDLGLVIKSQMEEVVENVPNDMEVPLSEMERPQSVI